MTNKWNFRTPIGSAKFKDFELFKSWYYKEGYNWGVKNWKDVFYKDCSVVGGNLSGLLDKQYGDCSPNWLWEKDSEKYKAERDKRVGKKIEELQNFLQRLEDLNQPLNVFYQNKVYCLVGSSKIQFIFPSQFLEVTLLKDYSDIPISALKSLTSHSEILSSETALATKSVNDVKKEYESESSRVEKLKQEIKDIKAEKNTELQALKAEIEEKQKALDKRKQELMAEIGKKKEELEEKMRGLKIELFTLESEIYCIRCFLGEVVNFVKVREGKTCSPEDQIVLYQKLRFLDEEMGKLVSLYNFDGGELKYFEQVLKNRDDVFETFCPSSRCISLVKVSRTEKQFFPDDKCANMLEDYETYHGNQIGILIRDNENLYIGWTDEEKIRVKDDFFYTPKTVIINPDDVVVREKTAKEQFEEAMNVAKDMVSRKFIFSILQGICENERPLIQVIDEYKPVTINSKAFIFSSADNQLSDNKYGSFAEIVEKCNKKISLRDRVLTVQGLRPGHISQWDYRIINDRGRGYADRTHDCYVENCEIYPINMIESEGMFTKCEYTDGKLKWTTTKEKNEQWHFCDGIKILWEEDFEKFRYYVSVEKEYSLAGARSNFQVYPEEFINLQYMNSEWLTWAITTRKLGGWKVGGQEVDYAYAVKYLRKALEYVKERETEEEQLISKYLDLSGINDWMVKLSEWKLENNIRWITDFQAKRFAKSFSKKENQA